MPSRLIAPLAADRLFHHIRQQAEKTRPLDRLGKLALPLGRDRGDPAGNDLAALRDEALQELDVFVVDLWRVRSREGAGLPAPEEGPAHRGRPRRRACLTLDRKST